MDNRNMEKKRKELLDWVYPIRCPVCDRPAPKGRIICAECQTKLVYVGENRCCRCGKPLKDGQQDIQRPGSARILPNAGSGHSVWVPTLEEEYCFDCKTKGHRFKQGAALYEYASIRSSLYRFKYQGRREYAQFYGRELSDRYGLLLRQWKPDAILPVPLHRAKMNKRGYNQAALIGRELSRRTGIPFYDDIISRQRNTRPMKNLDVRQRQINLKNAFIMSRNDVKLREVLIVDDIYTTGSTMDSIAGVLLENGIHNIYFLTMAIGLGM